MDVVEILFFLLRVELKGEAICDEVKKFINGEVLLELYTLSDKHDLAHIAGAALAKLGVLSDDEISKKFKKKTMLAIYRHEMKTAEYSSISELFENEKIEYLQLKGQSIAKYYPEPWMRTSCDIDVLVNEDELERAKNLLCEKLGYTVNKAPAYHDISMYAPSGMHFELHFRVRESFIQLDKNLSQLKEYVVKNDEGEYSLSLTNEFLFYYVIAHTAYHFVRSGCGIRLILDLWFLEKNLDFSEDVLRTLLDEIGLTVFYEKAKLLNAVWMDGAEHTPITKEMEDFILGSGSYGTQENNVAIAKGRFGGRKGYVMRRLFIPIELLETRYPILEKYPYFAPVMHVYRWCEAIFNKRGKKAITDLKMSGRISSDKTNSIANIMEELELKRN